MALKQTSRQARRTFLFGIAAGILVLAGCQTGPRPIDTGPVEPAYPPTGLNYNGVAVIVPLSLILIMMLLYSLFNSMRHSLLALSGIPFAVAGGILGLYVAGLNFSISAAIGFISLFGVSSMDGILLVSYIRKNLEEGLPNDEAIILAGETRMRQIFMTGLSACIGLVPAAISTGIGAQVQQPLACVVVGGMLLSPICSLLVIPTLARMVMPESAGPPGRAAAAPSRTVQLAEH